MRKRCCIFAFEPVRVVEPGTKAQDLIADLLLCVGQCEVHLPRPFLTAFEPAYRVTPIMRNWWVGGDRDQSTGETAGPPKRGKCHLGGNGRIDSAIERPVTTCR